MLRWTLSLHFESRQPSMKDQTRQDQEALEEAGIEKTELSADRAPSKAYLSEANASLALQKGFVDDSGLSCAPVAKHRMFRIATFAEELKDTSDGVSILRSELEMLRRR